MDQFTLQKMDDSANPSATLYDESAAASEKASLGIPWFNKADDDTRQIAANFLSYFSPIPENLTEKKYWSEVEFYNLVVRKNNHKPAAPSAGWRASFDDPGLAGWMPRQGYVKVTDSTASFDKYSVEAAPKSAKGDTIVIWKRAVPLTPDAKYTLSYDFKFDGVPHGGIRFVADGKNRTRLIRTVTKDDGKGFWINKSVKFTTPKNCTSADIYVFIGKGTKADAKAFVDNIVLTRQ